MLTRLILFIILLNINPLLSQDSTNFIFLKINPLAGERYVTKVHDFSEIESIFSSELNEKGYTVLVNFDEISGKNVQDSHLYLEVFLYQFPLNYPTMRVIIRDDAKILYEAEEYIKNFGSIIFAHEDLAIQLAQKIPHLDIILKKDASSEFTNFNKNNFTLNGLLTNSIMENTYIKKHQIVFELQEDSEIEFFYDEPIEEYLKNLTNFTGFRDNLKISKLKLHLEINEYGSTKLVKTEFPFELKKKHLKRIDNLVAGIPFWKNPNRTKHTAILSLSVK